jgi:hypothetical protein
MITKEVYAQFGIPLNLQEHMLKVSNIARLIAEGWKEELDKTKLVRASLVHDLANIVKFKLDPGSDLIDKQKETIEKYGADDHAATEKMLRELGLEEDLIKVVQMKSFGNAIEVAQSDNWILKILFYSDMRVVPSGVVDLETRLNDVVTRLEKYRTHPQKNELMQSARDVEKQVQAMTETNLSGITESTASTGMEDLLNVVI